jgi:2-oxoisovalerate dehydrogenase E1 component
VNNCAFHEGINMAATWDLPVVFVCENNMYATETPFERATKNVEVATRGVAYAIPGVALDGNDVLAVHAAAGAAVDRARSGSGPSLLECKTYRPGGHFEGDPGTGYRPKEEIAEWKKRDPLDKLRADATAGSIVSVPEFEAIDREVEAEVTAAYEFARTSPEADAATVAEHVYA